MIELFIMNQHNNQDKHGGKVDQISKITQEAREERDGEPVEGVEENLR